MEYETFEDVAAWYLASVDEVYNSKRFHSALGCRSPATFKEKARPGRMVENVQPDPVHSQGACIPYALAPLDIARALA